ncbi:MAG TPA: DegT/DnrJ/EryC1/StrS family aminotransferase [Armatimonadota bacterium]|jgi:dTDP-4-amino-4,6-dideoxygalactose transaminase
MSMTITELSDLAINGGPKVRTEAFPERVVVGLEEKAAVDKLFDDAIAGGEPLGYNGTSEQAFCREFAEFMGGGYADAVNSGTTAVYVALRALDLEPFSEVIVGPITDPGGMMPVALINCVPVIPDSAPGQYNTGPEQIEKMITPLTRAIVVAHIAGDPADIEGIMAVARKHNLKVVEDCAQAHMAKINGKLVGTFGDVAAFSTMFGKHCCTGGQGGVVFTKDEALFNMVRRTSDRGKPFGLPDDSTNVMAALNCNLNDLAACIGRVQLKKLPGVVARRRELAAALENGLADVRSIKMAAQLPGAESSYWFLRLELDTDLLSWDKDKFCEVLEAEGLPIIPYYRSLPHTYDWFKNRRVYGTSGLPWSSPLYKGDPNREFPTPNAMEATGRQFNLMVHEGWTKADIADAVAVLKKVESACLK